MSTLKDKWNAFGSIIFDPWVILLLFSTIGLFVLSTGQENATVVAMLTLLVGLFSGVLGGIVAKRWDDMTEEKVIKTRARSAHRSLELILSSIIALERRIRNYIERHNNEKLKKQITSEVVKTYFEEIVINCVGLEEKVINSIEDWKDILPDLEVKTVINLLRELNANYDNALIQLAQVNDALQETKNNSVDERNKLEEEKKEISKELSRIQRELREKSNKVGVPLIGGSIISGSTDAIYFSGPPYTQTIDQASILGIVPSTPYVVPSIGRISLSDPNIASML